MNVDCMSINNIYGIFYRKSTEYIFYTAAHGYLSKMMTFYTKMRELISIKSKINF